MLSPEQWTAGESNPDLPGCRPGRLPKDSSPTLSVVAEGQLRERELNPPRRAYETLLEPLQSIPQITVPPGRTRTCDPLRVKEAPLPLGHGSNCQ